MMRQRPARTKMKILSVLEELIARAKDDPQQADLDEIQVRSTKRESMARARTKCPKPQPISTRLGGWKPRRSFSF